jgi:two-component system sensor histidine kinase ChiS
VASISRLNTKLAVTVLGSVLITSVVIGALVIQSITEVLHKNHREDGQALAGTIAAMSVEPMLSEDFEVLKSHITSTTQSNQQVLYIRVHDEEETLRVAYPQDAAIGPIPEGSSTFSSPIVVAVDDLPIEIRGKVEVALKNDRLEHLIWTSVRRLSGGTLLTSACLAVALLFFLRRNVSRPLALLDRHVARIAGGDLSHAVSLPRADEIGRLAAGLEAMRSNLKESNARIESQVSALQDLDRMKDEFLANTSHELKTPLNGIIGLSESLLMGSYGDLRQDQEEAVELISSCATRLWKMTESILKFSRLHREDPDEQSAFERHHLAEHVEDALADLRASAAKSGIEIIVSVPRDLEPVYPRNELEQVLRILVDNAAKYTERGSVEILAQGWEGKAVPGFQLAVRDTGPGIPEALHARIFEPFVQGSEPETRTKGGVGLGLSIASKLVQRMGGDIVLESTPGRGSTFTVLVPERKTEAAPRSFFRPWPPRAATGRAAGEKEEAAHEVVRTRPQGPAPSNAEAAHVLVVDDEHVNREVAWQALREDFRVTLAADGRSALEVLRAEPVDLVLLDVMMPGMSGFDTLEIMRREKILERVPVIILSAKTSREAVVRGLELGASDYLSKPFHRAELLCRLRNQLQLKKQRDQLRAEVRAKTNALQLAENASEVKTQFLANMSHEIRTPLNGILGFVELAEEAASSPEQREHLAICRERAQYLLSVVDEVLDMAQIESRAVRLQPGPCVPLEVLRGAEASWGPEARRKGLDLRFSLGSGLDRTLWLDGHKLEQILSHLLSNAVKFTERGWIEVKAGLREMHGEDSVLLELQVTDTGAGISEIQRELIFQPFAQADSSTTRAQSGVGLGLSISRSFAHMMGGDIEVESVPGQGSTFSVRLPALTREPEALAEPVGQA